MPLSLGLIACIAIADHAIGNRASLGLLYILPMIVAASALRPVGIVALALVCSGLRVLFDIPAPPLESFLRSLFAFLSYAGLGLFVAAVRREQALRQHAEEQLEVLVESSPAAIVTVDGDGVVLAANKAAGGLLMLPENSAVKGRQIGGYLPVLKDALQFDPGPQGLRTAAQCQGFRENGEMFLASMWFSTWNGPQGKRLAAIVVDSSEDMRDREEENLRQLLHGNRIAAAAVSHEVRNLCGAISVIAANLSCKPVSPDADVQALTSLVKGLEKVASLELQSYTEETPGDISLQSVLDDLRIVVEPQWREIGGAVHWHTPSGLPRVIAERFGLLQAFLNLAQNSRRAVQECALRELTVSVCVEGQNVVLRFSDSGPGVAAPERLFEPFQQGSNGAGLGLYVSRAVVRGYGGDLRWEGGEGGSRFAVELQFVREEAVG